MSNRARDAVNIKFTALRFSAMGERAPEVRYWPLDSLENFSIFFSDPA